MSAPYPKTNAAAGEPLSQFLSFEIPTTGWKRLSGLEELAKTTGLGLTVYGCELPTGLKLTAMLGAGGVMVSVADAGEIEELPQRLADQVWRVAHAAIKAGHA